MKDGKKEISLIVSDVDNTVSDFFNTWGRTTDKAVKQLAKSRKLKPEQIWENIGEHASGHAKFHDIEALIKETPILHNPKNAEEAKRFEKDDARIIHECEKVRNSSKLYKGVLATVKKAKKAGAGFVLYTDAPMQSVLKRLSEMKFPAEMIDAIYAQDDRKKGEEEKKPPMQVKSEFSEFKKAMEGKTNYSTGWKPDTEQMQMIMDEFGVKDPSKAVMVGDNIKSDGGGAVPLGMEFAWQKDGARAEPVTEKVNGHLSDRPDYKVGVEGHLSQITDENRPTIVLEGGFKDLDKACKFVALDRNEKAKQSKASDKSVSSQDILAKKKTRSGR